MPWASCRGATIRPRRPRAPSTSTATVRHRRGRGHPRPRELRSASARGARIYAELRGYGMTCDAFSIAAPDPEGTWAAKAMEVAIARSGLGPDRIGYINAHGTSTQANDKVETLAIKRVFGLKGYPNPPISSSKSMIGHTLGAAGALEAAITALSSTMAFASHDQPREGRPRLRPRLHPQGSPRLQDRGGHLQLLRLRRAQLRALLR